MLSLLRSSAPVRGELLFGCILVLGIAGCGADQYESRLKQSSEYYKYLAMVEQNLAPKWSDGVAVEMMRVPKQFYTVLAPTPVKNDDGGDALPAVDPRQPDYLNLIFPNDILFGAWEAPVSVDGVDGSADARKAYIYVLSNYWMFTREDPAEALTFTNVMVQLVGDALEEHIPTEKLEKPDTELHPNPSTATGKYLVGSSYDVYAFRPKAITQRSAERETTVNYSFTMYAKTNGNIKAVVLVVQPVSTPPQEKLLERIPLMLDYFHITKNEPKPSQAQGGGAAATPPTSGF